MHTFTETLAIWPREALEEHIASARSHDVLQVLARNHLSPRDFLTLLSPAADEYLEQMAQKANAVTRRNFGKAINIFTPLYISDICVNRCRYCGFKATNKQKRRHLDIDEAVREARHIAALGFQHILVLTGDARHIASPAYIAEVIRQIKPFFPSVGIEVYSLTAEEYGEMISAGVDSLTMFQETYNRELYDWLHPQGPKRDYLFRLDAPARAASRGMRSIGIGALLGLDLFEMDGFYTGLHALWLLQNYPGAEVSVSIPRICPHEGNFEIKHGVTDRQLARYVTALRLFLPRCGITCSSRESAFMRDHLIPLGVTRVSAGVSTAVGGRATPNLHNPGQFEISDSRSLSQMQSDLMAHGYQPVMKDWETI